MSQKLAELKKQAAEIAEQIRQLEAESPEERLRSAIFAPLDAASVKSINGRYVGVLDPYKITDEIMEAVNEYVSEAVSDESFMNNELTLVLKNQSARIAELESALGTRDEMAKWLKENIQSVKSINDDLVDIVIEKDARIDELVKQLAEKDEQLINVSAELDAVRSDRDEPRGTVASFTTKTEPMPLRPAIEYLKEFPEPYRTAALKAVEERPKHPSVIVSNAADALAYSFDWADGTDKWFLLRAAVFNGTEWPAAELFND